MQVNVNIHELMSHAHHGVDNTGNTRVWDSSLTLTHALFYGALPKKDGESSQHSLLEPFRDVYHANAASWAKSRHRLLDNILSLAITRKQRNGVKTKVLKVIELGAGMAGLGSLSLASFGILATRLGITTIPAIEVSITDGHPDAVLNNQISACLTSALYCSSNITARCTDALVNEASGNMNLQCLRLLWKDNQEGARECRSLLLSDPSVDINPDDDHLISLEDGYDLCIISDCTHFTECHVSLIATIGRLLRVGGVCLLCQPIRGDTLKRFMEMIRTINENGVVGLCSHQLEDDPVAGCLEPSRHVPLFEVHLYEKYDDVLYMEHTRLLYEKSLNGNDNALYDPSIHFPLLLTLTKCRHFDELIDLEAVRDHSEKKKNNGRLSLEKSNEEQYF